MPLSFNRNDRGFKAGNWWKYDCCGFFFTNVSRRFMAYQGDFLETYRKLNYLRVSNTPQVFNSASFKILIWCTCLPGRSHASSPASNTMFLSCAPYKIIWQGIILIQIYITNINVIQENNNINWFQWVCSRTVGGEQFSNLLCNQFVRLNAQKI